MKNEGLKSNLVTKLQNKLFPLKGSQMGIFTDSSRDDPLKEPKDDSKDGYTCHRLQPPLLATPSPKSSLSSLAISPELYNVVREACAQQNVKWPVECQVIAYPVNHIEDWPLYPESFYQPTGRELRPQPVGDEMGRIVYQYYPTSAVNYFTRSCLGGNKQISQDVRPPLLDEDDSTLQFESRFESGNLAKAVQISECYYELHIRSDLYTARHTQWYYFSVSNTRKDITYRFSIVNLSKGDSLYNHGMRPLLYSKKEAQMHNIGWRRCASNIVYFRNQDCESGCFDSDDEGDEEIPSYTLTFNVTFPHDYDMVFLTNCFPYTYSMLQQHLLTIQNDPYRSSVCRQRVLCRSLAGNPVYLLTITGQEPEDDHKKKRAVVLSARVHPGETPSSWIMKGTLDFLTSDDTKAVELRRQFVFKVIPMVNPDGVIVGNHRCSLAGRDLNRQYKMVVKEMFPAVWHAKAMVRRLMDEHGVVMFCDFHAHSRKHNIFLYGCENRRSHENHLREQIFPLILYYNAGDKFSFRNCKFRVQRCKEGTARVVVWMMGILHSYTLESSFGGASEGPRAGTHYSIHDFLTMGKQFCESLGEYFDTQPVKEKLRNRLWSRLVKKGSNADEPAIVDLSDSNSSSGDSDPPPPPRPRRKRLTRTQKKRAHRLSEKPSLRTLSTASSPSTLSGDDSRHDNYSLTKNTIRRKETKSATLALLQPTHKVDNNNHISIRCTSPGSFEGKCSMECPDDVETSVNAVRLGDMLSHRLSLSDNEGDPTASYWEFRNPTSQWEAMTHSTSSLNRIGLPRCELNTPPSQHLEALEPVIAKTHLHEPRLTTRSTRSIPSRSQSQKSQSRVGGGHFVRLGKIHGASLTSIRNRVQQRHIHKNLLDKNLDNEKGLRSSSITPDPEEPIVRFKAIRRKSNVSIKAKDSLNNVLRHEGNLNLDQRKIYDVDFSKYPQTLKCETKKEPNQLDEDSLCADIASCDTLFLDTGLKETTTLKAARNLKGKVKKKKLSKSDLLGSESRSEINLEDGNTLMNLAQNSTKTIDSGNLNETIVTAEGKIKKKIKIVIGKKVKSKSSKKK